MSYRSDDRGTSTAVRRRRVFAAVWAAIVLAVVIVFHAVLVPFVLGALIAYVLAPAVRGLTRISIRGGHMPQWAAVVILYAFIVGGLVVGVRSTAPWVASEIRNFIRDEVPRIREEAGTRWLPKIRSMSERFSGSHAAPAPNATTDERDIVVEPRTSGGFTIRLPIDGVDVERRSDRVWRVVNGRAVSESHRDEVDAWLERLRALGAGHTEDVLRFGRGLVGSIVGFVFGFFITLMLSAYLLLTHERIFAFLESLFHPNQREAFRDLVHRIDRGLAGVVRGQLVICAINGVLSAVGFALAHLPYWPLLACLAAAFSIIPIFGSILSSVPAVAVGLRFGIPTGVFVLLWILGIHQLEANVLNPKIMGDAAKINPVLVVFSLLAGEHFFGILGALLAVPAMSITQSVFLHWRKLALNYGDTTMPGETLAPPPPPPSKPPAGD